MHVRIVLAPSPWTTPPELAAEVRPVNAQPAYSPRDTTQAQKKEAEAARNHASGDLEALKTVAKEPGTHRNAA